MKIREHAESATKAVSAVLGTTLPEDQAKRVADEIERVVINAVLEERQRFSSVAKECCSPDLDTAHKIARQIQHDNEALIANLSGLR